MTWVVGGVRLQSVRDTVLTTLWKKGSKVGKEILWGVLLMFLVMGFLLGS